MRRVVSLSSVACTRTMPRLSARVSSTVPLTRAGAAGFTTEIVTAETRGCSTVRSRTVSAGTSTSRSGSNERLPLRSANAHSR
jgi:hypothetical protein